MADSTLDYNKLSKTRKFLVYSAYQGTPIQPDKGFFADLKGRGWLTADGQLTPAARAAYEAATQPAPVININNRDMTEAQATLYVTEFALRSSYGAIVSELEAQLADALARETVLATNLARLDAFYKSFTTDLYDALGLTYPGFDDLDQVMDAVKALKAAQTRGEG